MNLVPLKGDYAIYDIRSSNHPNPMVQKDKIINYDKYRDIYTILASALQEDGSERILGQNSELGEDLKTKYIVDIKGKCRELNGIIQTVVVPAGTFTACQIKYIIESGIEVTQWLGENLPFGFVREESLKINTNERRSKELRNFGHE